MSDHEAGLSSSVPKGDEHRWGGASGPQPADPGLIPGCMTHSWVGPQASDSTPLGLSDLVLRKGTVPQL